MSNQHVSSWDICNFDHSKLSLVYTHIELKPSLYVLGGEERDWVDLMPQSNSRESILVCVIMIPTSGGDVQISIASAIMSDAVF